MQIQISWLLKKPTDLDLHCLQRQGISGFNRTRVNKWLCPVCWWCSRKQLNAEIVPSSMKSRSRSVMVNGSGQDASWQMCVWSFISLEALMFEKQSLTHRLNIVAADANDDTGKWSLCHSCLLKQLWQKAKFWEGKKSSSSSAFFLPQSIDFFSYFSIKTDTVGTYH